ncbi:DoxX family protein [Mesorhizobium sp. CN2-181]|uniref:DoxX family protein n=1 Tax=Mesorhizobium yinganensis TaxID=3157707 RepID=UPI0032B83B4B
MTVQNFSSTLRISRVRLADIGLLAGRFLLALIFVHEGFALTLHFGRVVQTMAQLGISLPLVIAVIALQIGAGLSIGLGLLTRFGAIALGLFCLATATMFHTNFANQNELLHFEKDLAIAGGMFVLAIAGAGALSFDAHFNRR